MNDWLDILKREIAARSATAVAAELGYARPTISLAASGNYPGSTARIAAKVLETYAREIACPHRGVPIAPAECKRDAERADADRRATAISTLDRVPILPFNPAAKAAPPQTERIT